MTMLVSTRCGVATALCLCFVSVSGCRASRDATPTTGDSPDAAEETSSDAASFDDGPGEAAVTSADAGATHDAAGPCAPKIDTDLSGIDLFPADDAWNVAVDTRSVDPTSDTIIQNHAGGPTAKGPSALFDTSIPYNVVSCVPFVSFTFAYGGDLGPYPDPTHLAFENGPFTATAKGDHHCLVVDRDKHTLYELYQARDDAADASGTWLAQSGAVWDLTKTPTRANGTVSADAAGLAILPGLLKFDEVMSGEVKHALRFTLSVTRQAFVAPATTFTRNGPKEAGWAPMGARFRLKSSFDITKYTALQQTILKALKRYGVILADNGSFSIGAAQDPRWVSSGLAIYPEVFALGPVLSDFEVLELGAVMTQ